MFVDSDPLYVPFFPPEGVWCGYALSDMSLCDCSVAHTQPAAKGGQLIRKTLKRTTDQLQVVTRINIICLHDKYSLSLPSHPSLSLSKHCLFGVLRGSQHEQP